MGGIEPTLYRGSVWYTPIVQEWYYQVEVLKLEVGSQNLNLDCREVNFKPFIATVYVIISNKRTPNITEEPEQCDLFVYF